MFLFVSEELNKVVQFKLEFPSPSITFTLRFARNVIKFNKMQLLQLEMRLKKTGRKLIWARKTKILILIPGYLKVHLRSFHKEEVSK